MKSDHWAQEQEVKPPLVLLAGDDPQEMHILANLLKEEGYRTSVAMNFGQAQAKMVEHRPEIVVVDPLLPGMEEPENWPRLRDRSETDRIPILVLKQERPPADFYKRYSGDWIDYLGKPIVPPELISRLRLHFRLKRTSDRLSFYDEQLEIEIHERLTLARENALLHQDMEEKDQFIEKMAITDTLTRLYNYRYIMERLTQEIAEAKRYGNSLSLVLVDIDGFKSINATFGHHMGDEVIARVAENIQDQLREVDIVSRYSGEEFLIVLPHTDGPGCRITAERIRERIEGLTWDVEGLKVTISGGVATLSPDNDADLRLKPDNILYKLIMRADDLLYKAKVNGRNRVEQG